MEQKRRREFKAASAQRARRAQERAAARRQPRPRWRRPAAYALWVLAAFLGVGDFLVYTGVVDVLTPDAGTVLLGLPAAFLLLVGAIVYGT